MNKYFLILNWTELFVLMLVWFRVEPMIGTSLLTIGSFIGAMMTGGLISWQYNNKTKASDKPGFEAHYFEKNYQVEVLTQGIVALLFLLAGMFIWKWFYLLGGIFLMWFVNITTESIYAEWRKRK